RQPTPPSRTPEIADACCPPPRFALVGGHRMVSVRRVGYWTRWYRGAWLLTPVRRGSPCRPPVRGPSVGASLRKIRVLERKGLHKGVRGRGQLLARGGCRLLRARCYRWPASRVVCGQSGLPI